jgi:hypothetical protein
VQIGAFYETTYVGAMPKSPSLGSEEECFCWSSAAASALQGHAGHPRRIEYAMADADALVEGLRARLFVEPEPTVEVVEATGSDGETMRMKEIGRAHV